MGWFLIRKKFCVSATLIAFLIQSVASFGHIHLQHIGTQSVAAGSVSTADPGKDGARAPFDGDLRTNPRVMSAIYAPLSTWRPLRKFQSRQHCRFDLYSTRSHKRFQEKPHQHGRHALISVREPLPVA